MQDNQILNTDESDMLIDISNFTDERAMKEVMPIIKKIDSDLKAFLAEYDAKFANDRQNSEYLENRQLKFLIAQDDARCEYGMARRKIKYLESKEKERLERQAYEQEQFIQNVLGGNYRVSGAIRHDDSTKQAIASGAIDIWRGLAHFGVKSIDKLTPEQLDVAAQVMNNHRCRKKYIKYLCDVLHRYHGLGEQDRIVIDNFHHGIHLYDKKYHHIIKQKGNSLTLIYYCHYTDGTIKVHCFNDFCVREAKNPDDPDTKKQIDLYHQIVVSPDNDLDLAIGFDVFYSG